MPASPSFHSDGRGKWKRRKREPQITRKQQPKHEDPDEEDEDDAVDDDNNNNLDQRDDDFEDPNPNHNPQDPNHVESEVLVDNGFRICDFPPVTKIAVNRPHASVLAISVLERANLAGDSSSSSRGQVPDLENVSHGQLQALSAVPAEGFGADQERYDGGNSAYVVTPPPILEGTGVVKRFGSRVHIVPLHSDWFSPAVVNRLERQVVPHFFSGKSPEHSPEKYMECRNYVVAKYMENPEKRIAVSDCLGLVAGVEDEDLARIVRFLDHWGIINYCAATPSRESWNGGSYLREDSNGEVHVPSAALKSVDSLIKFEKPKCRFKAAEIYASLSCRDDDFSDLDDKIRESLSDSRCAYCSQSLPTIYYQSQKEIDVLLCSDCFHEGRFVTGHSSLDFVKTDPMKDNCDLDGESWSDQETFLLLEAMEIYNDNWNEIAEHVGTKSKSQCILHFLRLPMEDGLLENVEVPSVSKSSNPSSRDDHARLHSRPNGGMSGPCLQDIDSESRIPFANSGNPIMALVAFLASAVGPRVAAACAHASLAALSEDHKMNSERSYSRDGNFHDDAANSVQQTENLHGSWTRNEAVAAPLSAEKVDAAAKAGLAAAATKAKLFADHEEREIQRLSANIINHQLKRLELKLKQFAEVETLLMRECEQVEKTRQRFAAERVRLLSTRVGPAGATSQMNMAGISPSLVVNNSIGGNNRQQVVSPTSSSSQPSVSGYGNNQQVHPHLSFMQRGQAQPMFPLGPRLPLSAIQPSSSAPPNAMFNASGNPQPNLNQMLRSVSGPSSGLG